MKSYPEIDRLRGYSSAFSRSVFSDIMEYDDYSRLDTLFKRYDSERLKEKTYFDYLKYAYRTIAKHYKCEYVYKNEIINKLLLKEYGTQDTIVINEFRVQNSIVDFALFNGESKAFEIKTEYDSRKRLDSQIQDYAKLFQKCYIVIPESLQQQYKECTLNKNVGIIILLTENGNIKLKEVRKAIANKRVDVDVLMRSIRTNEYKNIVSEYFGKLPNVSCFEMFEKCQKKIKQIPQKDLQKLVLDEIKKRKTNTQFLIKYPKEIRQMCLSLNLTWEQYVSLSEKLNNPIIA